MTAEIAIINRSAVTLAADSAVTLTVRGTEKIYNSADKLFELSNKDPLGVLVYNNLEYMGVVLEVAIKKFRDSAPHFDNVFSAADAFFKFLIDKLPPDEQLQKQHAKALIMPFYWDIRTLFERRMTREYETDKGNKRKKNNVDPPTLFSQTVQSEISELESLEMAECFTDVSESFIEDFYSESLNELVKDIFEDLPLDDEHKSLLKRAGILFLHRNKLSESSTGLVFAGFGKDEMFPSLIAYETDGVILGKLKKIEIARETTSRSEVTGRILPFAQTEMVDRFLYGIDPQFEHAIENYIRTAVEETGAAIAKELSTRSKATRQKLANAIISATEAAVATWHDKMIPLHKGRFMRDVQNMIFLMPKQELAILAQELINLTSVKRKFSSGRESVGGPIDVAVISRIDGFVWVRRKHYFDPKLNPRYFHRKFGVHTPEPGDIQ